MQRRNQTLLLCAFALLGGAGWLLWPPSELPPPVAPGLVPAAPAAPAAARDPAVAVPAAELRVRVTVRELRAYVPPPPPVPFAGAPGEVLEPGIVLAGSGANPFVPAPRAGLALVGGPGQRPRWLRLAAVAPDQPPSVHLGPRTMVRGRVRDARGGPLGGVSVSLGELDDEGGRRCATTDADGAFELDTPAGDAVPLLLEAAGSALQWRALRVVGNQPNQVDVQLPDGGQLEVQLAAPAPDVEAARVYVVPGAAVASELAQFPFFLQALSRGTPADAAGRATVAGLPRAGEVGVVVVHPGAPIGAPVPVRLLGARTVATVPLRPLPLRPLRVVDDAGEPVAFAVALWRQRGAPVPASASLRLLPPLLDAAGAIVAHGDDQGGLHLAPPAPLPGTVLSLRAPGHAGVDLELAQELPEAAVLPRWRGGGEPALRLLPPRPGVRWASEWNLAGGLVLEHAADEAPAVALPRAGRYEVELETSAGGRVVGRKVLATVDATGPVEVAAPRPE